MAALNVSIHGIGVDALSGPAGSNAPGARKNARFDGLNPVLAPHDVYNGDGGNNTYTGTADPDTINGNGGNDILAGAGGGDTISGGDGADYLFGDSGDPLQPYGDDILFGDGGDDFLIGGLGNDTLNGGADNDTLVNGVAYIGSPTVGTFMPFPGILSYYGRVDGGNDIIDGGSGTDLAYLFYNRAAGITLDNSNPALVNTIFSGGIPAGSITGVERLVFWGGDGVDTITGGAMSDTLQGMAGNDVLRGGGGDDTLEGGAGDDIIDGGEGTYDAAGYFGAAAGVTVDLRLQGQAQNTGGDGIDTLTGIENLVGSLYTDTLSGDDGANLLGDYVSGNDQLFGLGGDDTLEVYRFSQGLGATTVLLDGGDGNDTLIFNALPGSTADSATLIGGADDDTLTIIGGAGSYLLNGGAGADTITGGDGGDEIHGGTGVDTIQAGGGNDTIVIDAEGEVAAGEIVNGGTGTDTLTVRQPFGVEINEDISGATLTSIEILDSGQAGIGFKASQLTDVTTLRGRFFFVEGGQVSLNGISAPTTILFNLNVAGNTLDLTGFTAGGMVIIGGDAGDDTVIGAGTAENVYSYGGNDTLYGNGGDDILNAGEGDDRLDGGVGADNMAGGLGDDTYVIDSINDEVIEMADEGTDTVESWIGIALDSLFPGQEVENVTLLGTAAINAFGNADANTLIGNSANNLLSGLAGADRMEGREGNDRYTVDNSGDIVIEAFSAYEEYDTVTSSISYTLAAGTEIERFVASAGTAAIDLTGNDYRQRMEGNNGANTLMGGIGDDALKGFGGDDVLIGGIGNDKMSGGLGADRFVFEIGGQRDMVTDFELGTDKLDLTAFGLTWGQVSAAMSESGGITTIDLGNGDTVSLRGIAMASLDADDFLLSGGSSALEPLAGNLSDGLAIAPIDHGVHQLQPLLHDLWSAVDWHMI